MRIVALIPLMQFRQALHSGITSRRGGGGKNKCSTRIPELKPEGFRFEDEGEDNTHAGRCVKSGGVGLESTNGTWSDSSGRERHYQLESLEEKQPRSELSLGAARRSDPDWDSGRELGLPQPSPGLDLGIWAVSCPVSSNRSTLNGLILHEPTCSKAQDGVSATGLRQSLFSRPFETS